MHVQVRKATDAFMEKFQHPAQFQTPSIDFSKPRLVQISVTDVGACMPIIPVVSWCVCVGGCPVYVWCVPIIPVVSWCGGGGVCGGGAQYTCGVFPLYLW